MGKSAEQLQIEKSLLWATLADCYEALLSMVKDSLPENVDLRIKIVLARHALDMTRDLDMVIDPDMLERIEHLEAEVVPTMTPEHVHAALYALNAARQKTINREVTDWTDDDAARAQWNRIHDLDARVAAIERAWPMFRVWYDDHEHDSYVLVPRR